MPGGRCDGAEAEMEKRRRKVVGRVMGRVQYAGCIVVVGRELDGVTDCSAETAASDMGWWCSFGHVECRG